MPDNKQWLAILRKEARVLQSLGEILSDQELMQIRVRAYKHPDEALIEAWVRRMLQAKQPLL